MKEHPLSRSCSKSPSESLIRLKISIIGHRATNEPVGEKVGQLFSAYCVRGRCLVYFFFTPHPSIHAVEHTAYHFTFLIGYRDGTILQSFLILQP